MKTTIFIITLTILATSYGASVFSAPSTRNNLVVGNIISGDRLLLRQYLYRQAIPNSVQSEDLVYRGNVTTRITAVWAREVGYTQYGTPWIIAGGVGYNNVTLRVQSYRGYGYYYLVEIYGR